MCVCVCVLFQAEEEESVDKYHDLRVHCWVLVLSGKREVPQSFFIEPTTGEGTTDHVRTVFTVCVCMCVCVCVCVSGECHAMDSELYLGIESLWNHRNYWINMQDCAHGLEVTYTVTRACTHTHNTHRVWCLTWEMRRSGSSSSRVWTSLSWWSPRTALPLWERRNRFTASC